MLRLEGLAELKNSITSSGIERAVVPALNLGWLHPIACEIQVMGLFRLRSVTLVGYFY
jgi:hypothetical protein